MSTAEVQLFADANEVGSQVCSYIEQVAELTIAEKGRFVIGVSGGSVATLLNKFLPDIHTDWASWHVFLCDERIVAKDDPECTWTIFKDGLLSSVEIGEERLYGVEDPEAPIDEIVESYAAKLGEVCGGDSPAPDMVILGLGPDGHTASLFPNHSSLDSTAIIVAEEDSPKPPPTRISMSVKTLNSSTSAVFIACGDSKDEVVAQILEETSGTGSKALPASLINPAKGCLSWYLDFGAAKCLKPPVISPHQKRTMEAAFTFKDMINSGSKEGEEKSEEVSEEASEEKEEEAAEGEEED